ncbi:secreted RxLR effector peptide protein, putative [Phytophthora infestans T30-4]
MIMHLCRALLVTVFAFLASTDSLSAAAHSGQIERSLTKSSTTAIASEQRSLRLNDKANGMVGGEDTIEGRGGGKLSDYFFALYSCVLRIVKKNSI